MRKLLIIVIILVLVVLVAPFWFGIKAEDEYNKLIETASKIENLEIISRSYKRGWLKSSAEVTYAINNGEESSLKIVEKDTIYHGPIPIGLISSGKIKLKPVMAVIETTADIESDAEDEFFEIINSLPPFDVETTISLSGSGTYEASMPAVDTKVGENRTLKSSGVDGVGSFILDPSKVSSVFNVSEFRIEDDKAIVSLSDINMESNLFYPTSDFKNPLGNINVKLGKLSSEGKDGDGSKKVTINNFEITATTNQKGNLLNHIHSLGFEQITVGGNDYGPGTYELEIRNIDKAAFEEIQIAISESQTDANHDSASSTDLLIAEIMKTLPSLLKTSPEIELTKLSIQTDEGEITGNALISASGDSLENAELAANPIFLLAAVSAEINLSASKQLFDNLLKDYNIEEITDQINSSNEELPSEKELQTLAMDRAQLEIKDMLDQKILILKDGNYEIKLTYGLGQVTLNGNPLDLGALINQL